MDLTKTQILPSIYTRVLVKELLVSAILKRNALQGMRQVMQDS